MSEFGDTVRWRRKALGLRQYQLAALIKRKHRPTTASYISRIESGIIDPRLSTVLSLARALKMRPWQIFTVGYEREFWSDYLALPPLGKREIQRIIKMMLR